jgi:hypothetical protein
MPWLGWGRVRALRLNGVDVPILGGRVTFGREPVVGAPERKTWQVDIKIAAPWVLELEQYSVEAELDPDGVLAGPGRLVRSAGLDIQLQSDGPWTGVQDW